MSDFLSRIPFLKLLIPVVAGILANHFLQIVPGAAFIAIGGIICMVVSYGIKKEKQYALRWIFGMGLNLFLFGLISMIYSYHDKKTTHHFPETENHYIGYVMDIPQEKPRSIACNIQLKYPNNKKIIVYLQKDSTAQLLHAGDEILFRSVVQPFKNFGNPDDFDYEKFMKIKGYSGTTYLPSVKWQKTGKSVLTVSVISQQVRAKIIDFYRSFQLDPDAYAFVTALTIGYKSFLTDDMQESFRASGTSHVLAVSGLHVGIVFIIFSTLLSFLGKTGKRFQLRQLLIILALWFYAFVTGLSPSVMRAVIMLSIFCIGSITQRKGFTYNTVAIAAFAILLVYPYSLFDISFQMSFTAVLSILFFQPKLDKLFIIKNKVVKYIWNLFTVSMAAQIGVFPIVLYYFGTFPTYFFIANMLIVPLIGFIIYAIIPVIVLGLLMQSGLHFLAVVFTFFRWILKTLIQVVLLISQMVESLPYAQISNLYISATQMFLLLVFILALTLFLTQKRAKYLLATLGASLFLVSTFTFSIINKQPTQLVVYNKSGISDIGLFHNGKRMPLDVPPNGIIPHTSKRIVHLSENRYSSEIENQPFPVDILVLSGDRTFSIPRLNQIFQPSVVIIENTISNYHKKRLIAECNELKIKHHDVSQMGAFTINYE